MTEIHFKNGSVIETIDTKELRYMFATNKDNVLAIMKFLSENSCEMYSEYIRELKRRRHIMNSKDYIGKPLKKLVNDTPDYSKNFFIIYYNNDTIYMRDVSDEAILNKTVVDISGTHADYVSYITIK